MCRAVGARERVLERSWENAYDCLWPTDVMSGPSMEVEIRPVQREQWRTVWSSFENKESLV